MKKLLLATVAVVFGTSVAMAGTLVEPPIVTVTPPAPVAYDWSGFYGGVLGGMQSGEISLPPAFAFDATNYGGFAGYQFQTGNFVVGAEVDAQMGSADSILLPPGGADVDYLVDARLRVGYAFDHVMVYAAGGYTTLGFNIPTTPVTGTANGWNAGLGAEIAVTDSIFLGGEYIYRDLSGTANPGAIPFDYNSHGFQVRVGFRF